MDNRPRLNWRKGCLTFATALVVIGLALWAFTIATQPTRSPETRILTYNMTAALFPYPYRSQVFSTSGVLLHDTWARHDLSPLIGAAFSRDGRWLALDFIDGLHIESSTPGMGWPLVVSRGGMPAWSWMTDRLLFTHLGATGETTIKLVDLSCLNRIGPCWATPTPIGEGLAAGWSPDDKSIVVVQADRITLVDAETANELRTVERRPGCLAARWSPDGARIALGCDDGLWMYDLESSAVELLTERIPGSSFDWLDDNTIIAIGGKSADPSLGQRIVNRSPEYHATNGLFLVDTTTGALTRFTTEAGVMYDFFAIWPGTE